MIRTKKPGRKTKCPKKEIFEHLYYLENISASEIAKIYGVNTQCVYNWAAKFRKESESSGKNTNLSDKQIFTLNNNTKKKERSKIS